MMLVVLHFGGNYWLWYVRIAHITPIVPAKWEPCDWSTSFLYWLLIRSDWLGSPTLLHNPVCLLAGIFTWLHEPVFLLDGISTWLHKPRFLLVGISTLLHNSLFLLAYRLFSATVTCFGAKFKLIRIFLLCCPSFMEYNSSIQLVHQRRTYSMIIFLAQSWITSEENRCVQDECMI